MERMPNGPANEATQKEHAGLELKHWNMIQALLMRRIGKDAWQAGRWPGSFKRLLDREPELVAGFPDMTQEEQDKAVSAIQERLEQELADTA